MQLSNEQTQQFWEDGFIIVKNLLDVDEVASLLAHAEWVASGERPISRQDNSRLNPAWQQEKLNREITLILFEK